MKARVHGSGPRAASASMITAVESLSRQQAIAASRESSTSGCVRNAATVPVPRRSPIFPSASIARARVARSPSSRAR